MAQFKKKTTAQKILVGMLVVVFLIIFVGTQAIHSEHVQVSASWVMPVKMMSNATVCYNLPPLVLEMCDANNKTTYQPRSQTMCTTLNDGVYVGVQNETILRYNSTDTWGGEIKTIVRYSNNSVGDYVIKPWFAVDNSNVRCGDYKKETLACTDNSCSVDNISTGGL